MSKAFIILGMIFFGIGMKGALSVVKMVAQKIKNSPMFRTYGVIAKQPYLW